MKKRNTGKPSEAIFLRHWEQYGKRAFVHRMEDSAAINGLNDDLKHRVRVPKMPSDFLVTFDGHMFYAEVKSVTDGTGFKKSGITDVQMGTCRRQVAAGGNYFFFVHHLQKNAWYRVPGDFVLEYPKATIPWDHMNHLIWSPTEC